MAQWQKGQSGNPAGNVEHPLVRKVKARARLDAERAYEAILKMLHEDEKPEVRMAAAKQILAMAGANTPEKLTEQPNQSTATPSTPSQSLAKDLGPTQPTVN